MSISWDETRWALFALLLGWAVVEVVRAWRGSRGQVPRKRPLLRSSLPEQMLASDQAWQVGHRAVLPGHAAILVLSVVFVVVAVPGVSWTLILVLLALTVVGIIVKHLGARAHRSLTDDVHRHPLEPCI